MSVVFGHEAKFEIDGVEYCVVSVEIDAEADLKDVSCTGEGAQYKAKAAGQLGARLRVNVNHHPDENLLSDPPNVIEGATLTNVRLYPDREEADKWEFPELIVGKVHMAVNIGDVTKFDFEAESNGTYTRPS